MTHKFKQLKVPTMKINIGNFSILGRENQNLMRTIKEALYIRVNNPFLNRNIGKYHLPHIWVFPSTTCSFNTCQLTNTSWVAIPSANMAITSANITCN